MNYKVYQGSELKQTVTSKTAVMNGLQPNRTYEFGVQPNDGNRDGTKVATSVTTRGIRFNIPKMLTVGSTITLRYEEYPLGIVPIGKEPSGMFGGGNKQNLSAKVISTANGSSVVEVAGNVIDVGGRNYFSVSGFTANKYAFAGIDFYDLQLLPNTKYTVSTNNVGILDQGYANVFVGNKGFTPDSSINGVIVNKPQTVTTNSTGVLTIAARNYSLAYGKDKIQVELGTTATPWTPYAAFVDGDTFTVQPDGTCALFSEYKALYY